MKSFKQLSVRTFLALASASVALTACDGKKENVDQTTFRVETVTMEKSNPLKRDKFGLVQSKEFIFKACFTDFNSRQAVQRGTFTVSDGNSSQEGTPTDGDGCMTWKEVHTFDPLQKEEIVKLNRTFSSTENYQGDVTVELSFNPWQEVLIDLRRFPDPDLVEQMAQQQDAQAVGFASDLKIGRHISPFSRAAMTDVSLTFQGHDQESAIITPLLTLKPAQSFRLSMKPQFLRKNIRNDVQYLDLTGGEFRVRLVMVRENAPEIPNASDIVAYSDSVVKVRDKGLAETDLLLRIHDVSAILSRNKFFLIAQPLGTSETAGAGVYTGRIKPLQGNDALVSLIPFTGAVDGDLETRFIAGVESAMAILEKDIAPMELFAAESGLVKESGTILKDIVSQTKPTKEKNREALRSFCALLYTAEQTTKVGYEGLLGRPRTKTVKVLEECQSSPEKYMNIEQREIVQELNGKPRLRPDLIKFKKIEINKGLSYKTSEVIDRSSTWKHGFGWNLGGGIDLNANLGISTPKPPEDALVVPGASANGSISGGLKGSVGSDYGYARGISKVEGEEIGALISENYEFEMAAVGYDIKAKAKTCLLVGSIADGKGFYGCTDESKDVARTETYYQINQSIKNSVFADEFSAASTNWRITIRGNANYKAFEELMTKGQGVLDFRRVTLDSSAQLLPDFKVNQPFPGVLSK